MATASSGILVLAMLLFTGGCRAEEEEGGHSPALMCAVWNTLMEEINREPNLNGFTTANLDEVGPCTHIVFLTWSVFTDPDDVIEGAPDHWTTKAEYFRKGVELRNRRPDLKLLVTYNVHDWEVETEESRQQFVNLSVAVLNQHKLDGAILSRRAFATGNPENYVQLFSEMSSEFRKHNLSFSVQLPDAKTSAFRDGQYETIERFSDFVLLQMMPRLQTSPNSSYIVNPLLSENSTIEWYAGQGIPHHKMVAIFPLSVQGFKLKDPKEYGVGAETLGPGFESRMLADGQISASEMMKRLKNPEEGWVVRRDEVSNTPYAVNAHGIWATYEDAASLRTKANYLKNLGFGGVLLASLEVDDFRGEEGLGHFPLVQAMHDALQSDQ